MDQQEKTVKYFQELYNEASSVLTIEVPESVDPDTYGMLMRYMEALLQKKAGDKVDLQQFQTSIIEAAGKNQGQELCRIVRDAVKTAIDNTFGKSI